MPRTPARHALLPLVLAASLASGCVELKASQVQAAAKIAGAILGKQLLPPPKLISEKLIPLFLKGLAEGELPSVDLILKVLSVTNGSQVGSLPDARGGQTLDVDVASYRAAFALLDRSGVFKIQQGSESQAVGMGLANPSAELRWATENRSLFDDAPVFAASDDARRYRLQQAAEVDLRDEFPEVRNQGVRNTCVQFATAGHLTFLNKRAGLPLASASPQQMNWLYNVVVKSKIDPGNLWNDEGTLSPAFYPVLKLEGNREVTKQAPYVPPQLGYLPEEAAPYDADLERQPAKSDYAKMADLCLGKATATKVKGGERLTTQGAYYYRIKNDAASFEAALQDGHPIQVGYPVNKADWKNPEGARIPEYDQKKGNGGYHAVCIVGYQRDGEAPGGGWYVVRNSWGPDWGEGGYCYVSYQMTEKWAINPHIANAYNTAFKAKLPLNPPPAEPPAEAEVQAAEPLPTATEINAYTEADKARAKDLTSLLDGVVDDLITVLEGK